MICMGADAHGVLFSLSFRCRIQRMLERSGSSGVTKAQNDKSDSYRFVVPLFSTNRVMLRCPMCGHLFYENQPTSALDSSYVVTLDLNHICPNCRGEISRISASKRSKYQESAIPIASDSIPTQIISRTTHQLSREIRRSPFKFPNPGEDHDL